MAEENLNNEFDRRTAIRISCQSPLFYKICKEETLNKIMYGYIQNISKGGICCTIQEEVPLGSTIWMKLDSDALYLCEEIDRKAVIIQHGIFGKVVWVNQLAENKFEIGLHFITREEQ